MVPMAEARDVIALGVRFRLYRADPPAEPTGPPVLLLHGFPETAVMWRETLAELAADRIVLAPDLKGVGGSEARGPYDVTTLLGELMALVRAAGVAGRFDVVGHDWGGALAALLATRHADQVRRIVMINAPYRKIDYLRAWHMLLFSLPILPEALFGLGRGAAIGMMLRAGWRVASPLAPDVAEHYRRAYDDPARISAMLAYYRGVTRLRLRRGLRRFAGRTPPRGPRSTTAQPPSGRAQVVWGAADPVLPLTVGEAVAADLGAEMVTLPGVGHFSVEEASERVVPVVAEFLRRPEHQEPSPY